jgi:peptidoglycan/LPS O-acetylase OafA/YrhL
MTAATILTTADRAGRNPGLDALRCCAIVPVILYHAFMSSMIAEQLGFIGVDIFFVLSGFLIAGMIFERFDGVSTPSALLTFWCNRWIRTLPLYFVFLGVFVWMTANHAWISPPETPPAGTYGMQPPVWPYALFTQNLFTGGMSWNAGWFGPSWSLAVEEWFYLIFPIILFAAGRRNANRAIVAFAVAACMLALGGRLFRFMHSTGLNLDDMDDLFRRPVIFRLDTFCYGILIYAAMFRWRWPVVANARALFLTGTVGLLTSVALCVHPATAGFHAFVTYLTLTPVSVALMLPAFWLLPVSSRIVRDVLAFISTRTYALYLVHIPIIIVYRSWIGEPAALTIIPVLMLTLAAADIVYRCIERPVLALRLRVMPAHTRNAGPLPV